MKIKKNNALGPSKVTGDINGFINRKSSLFLVLVLVCSALQVFSVSVAPKAAAATCAQGGACVVGDRGPGGGIIFYVASANFSSPGSVCNNSCKYLEVAPSTWQSAGASVADDPSYAFSSSGAATGQDKTTISSESGRTGLNETLNWKIGQGFFNTSVMKVSGATSQPQAAVLAYAGNVSAGEWFLPSANELNELCKYARGQATGVPTVVCSSSGTLKTTAIAGSDLGGFVGDFYWSSSEYSQTVSDAMNLRFSTGGFGPYTKSYPMRVRPIRAVAAPAPAVTTTSLSIQFASRTYGASNTLQATISSNAATGTVGFMNNGAPISGCETSTVTSGIATCTTWKPGVGTYSNITAVYGGSSSFGTSTSTAASLTVTAATLTITASSTSVTYGASVPTVTASYSGLVNGDAYSVVGGQTCATTYTTTSAVGTSPKTSCSGGTASNYSIAYVDGAVTINKATPTFSTWSDVPKTFGNSPFTVTAPTVTGSLAGSFAYSSATTSVISISGSTFTVVGTGTSVITASFTPTDATNYNSATTTMTVSVGNAAQTITRTSTTPTSPVKAGTYTPTATASSSLTVSISIASGSSSVCSIAAGVVTFNAVGSCVIQYNQSGNSNYSAATQVTETLSIGKATPTFSTWSNVAKSFGNSSFTVTAPTVTGSLAGSFTYSSATTSVISISGSTFTVVGAGTSVITATFTPTDSANYNTATTTMTITVGFSSQSITRTSTSPSSPVKSGTYTPTATASSSLTVAISIAAGSSSVCSISAGIVTFNSVGSCVIQYNQSGNSNYLAATQVTETLSIGQEVPTFTWAGVSKIYGDIFSLTAPTPSTPGTFTYSSATTSVVTITSSTATITSNGTSIITATFTPNDTTNFVSGGTITMTISADRAAITVTPTAGQSKVYGENNPTITYSVTSGALVGSDVLNGALTYTGSNVGSYPISIGTLANSKYIITLTSVNFSITKATQAAVTLSSLSSAFSSSNKTVSLTGSGGTGTGSYLYALDSSNTTVGCSVTGSTLTYVTAGTCVVAVKRTSDINYLERTDAVSFSVGLASQSITFNSLSAKSYSSDTFTVSATSSASLTVVFTSGSPSICTTSGDSGSTITVLNIGTCIINANQIGDSNIAAASQVSQNFTVNPRAITVTADTKTKVYGAADPTFTYTITTGSLILGDAITGALTRAAGTDVGDYQIQQGSLTTATNPKYAITYVPADLTITRATPALVLTYPNSNVAILRPGAVDTPTVTTSSSSGALTFATSAASSICTVDSTSGVISLFGAGSCPVAMSTAITTNFIQHTETTTVTVALLSTSLVGIDQTDLVSMGQPFFAHASVDQAYSFSSGNNGASVAIPAGALDPLVPISIHLLTDSADQRAMIGGTGTSVLSVVVSWVAPDGSVPNTNTGKAISVTLTNSAIKKDAKVYSIIGSESRLLGTATADGSVTTLITEDPVLLVINPVMTTPAPSTSDSSRGSNYVMSVAVDNSAANSVANDKLAADKAAAELKALQEKAAAIAAEEAALKAAKELADKQAQAAAELKASQEKAAAELRIAEELRLAKLAAEAELKAAAEKKAALDAAAAIVKPTVTLYSLSSSLKLNAYDSAYLNKYVKSLKNGASVTCIGYSYSKNTTVKKATALAKSQATAVCALMKKTNKTLKTSVVVYPATKAPKAATGAKWVGVSYRIDGFKK